MNPTVLGRKVGAIGPNFLPRMIVAAALIVAGCGGGSDGGLTVEGERIPQRRINSAVEGLCEARDQAPADVTKARAAFYDRSHEMLHVIATALQPVDIPQAARLLEAKEAVESDLDGPGPTPPPDLVADLDNLLAVTRTGLDRLEVSAPRCPE